jgi:hypothetical protein
MRLRTAAAVLASIASIASPAGRSLELPPGDGSALFARHDPVELKLEAPFPQLFANGLDNERYTVSGTVSLKESPGAPAAVIKDVEISVRGNTSKRETECSFPKLKLKLPDGSPEDRSLFRGLDTVKIGTHCGEARAGTLTKRFGRLANETSPWREALVYRLVDAVGEPTLNTRPARITYVDSNSSKQLVRNALLIEDDDDAKKRLGGEQEISMDEFGNARERFSEADAARLAFAEALIGNFDWCLKFSPDDEYRCDQRKPLWNLVAFTKGSGAFSVMKDFDLAGAVTGRHDWFSNVYNEAFVPSKSHIEIEVLSQVQRTRSLFGRDVLDRARQEFLDRRPAVEQALADAAVDDEGRRLAQKYVTAFFAAIATDEAFYRPVVVHPNTRVFRDAGKSAEACAPDDEVPVGTPVNALRESQGMSEVVLLDALWRWSPPSGCDAVRKGTVWIESGAIDSAFPPSQRSR